MLNIKSKIEHESAAVPGVKFTVRTLNKIQRAKRDLPMASLAAEYTMAAEEHNSLLPQGWSAVQREKIKLAGMIADKADPAIISEAKAALERLESTLVDPPDAIAKRRDLGVRAQMLQDQMKLPVIKAGLVSIEGVQVDDKPITVDTLLESSSADLDDLIDEIYAACEAASGLSQEQQKNSQSPTISTAPVAGDLTTSGATPVDA